MSRHLRTLFPECIFVYDPISPRNRIQITCLAHKNREGTLKRSVAMCFMILFSGKNCTCFDMLRRWEWSFYAFPPRLKTPICLWNTHRPVLSEQSCAKVKPREKFLVRFLYRRGRIICICEFLCCTRIVNGSQHGSKCNLICTISRVTFSGLIPVRKTAVIWDQSIESKML